MNAIDAWKQQVSEGGTTTTTTVAFMEHAIKFPFQIISHLNKF